MAAPDHMSQIFPKRHRSLLNNVFGIGHIGNQRRDVTKDLPFAAQKQREKLLLHDGRAFKPELEICRH